MCIFFVCFLFFKNNNQKKKKKKKKKKIIIIIKKNQHSHPRPILCIFFVEVIPEAVRLKASMAQSVFT